ncbi:MAG TPA: SCO family protein [Elusimicrobiota bacterium]|nr:SCO family protein [Elusimicrobiota bacterium]
MKRLTNRPKAHAWGPMLLALWGIGCASGPRELPVLGTVGDFRLTAVTGEKTSALSAGALSGQVWIADFIWTRCKGPCFLMSGNMARLQRALPGEIRLVSISVDPERDDPKSLRAYSKHFVGQENRWFFLTGEKAKVYALIENGFKVSAAEDRDAPLAERFVHSTKFVLVDGAGKIRGYYDGEEPGEMKKLVRDARGLLAPPVAS